MTRLERFMAKVTINEQTSCWEWKAALASGTGYGVFWSGEALCGAHRWSYQHLVGPIPTGLELDHLCRVRHCVNPAHLEPVTRAENIRRSARSLRPVCRQGHDQWGKDSNGHRRCLECNRLRGAA